jgi:hypothetical protein
MSFVLDSRSMGWAWVRAGIRSRQEIQRALVVKGRKVADRLMEEASSDGASHNLAVLGFGQFRDDMDLRRD